MAIEKEFNIKKSKVISFLLKAALIAALFLSTSQVFQLRYLTDVSSCEEIYTPFTDYYVFTPNTKFSNEAHDKYEVYTTTDIEKYDAIVYTDHLKTWQKDMGIEILRFDAHAIYQNKEYTVWSYLNAEAYSMNWEDFSLPLKEGTWFTGNENEVICVNGSQYDIGDTVQIEEGGKENQATVVGKLKYPYIPVNTMPMTTDLELSLYKYDNTKAVFLLNPQSSFNGKSDLINYGGAIIKTGQSIELTAIREYGTCTKVSDVLTKSQNQHSSLFESLKIVFFILLTIALMILIHVLEQGKYLYLHIAASAVLAYLYVYMQYVRNFHKEWIVVGISAVMVAINFLVVRVRKTHIKGGKSEDSVLPE